MVSLPILLPAGFTPLVAQNDTVRIGQPIAHRIISTNNSEITVNIAEALGIHPHKTKKTVKKNPGDTIKPGDILAQRRTMLGLDEERVESEVTGVIVRFERDRGELVISLGEASVDGSPQEETMTAPIDGTIAIVDSEKIVIATDKDVIVGQSGAGEQAEGELFSLWAAFNNDPEVDTVMPHHLDGRVIGKIILGGNLGRDVLAKGIAMGVQGIVGVEMSEDDINYFINRNTKTPLLKISKDDMLKLHKEHSKKAYLEGMNRTIIVLNA